MKTAIDLNNLAFPMKVEQHGPEDFRVTYGKQVKDHLTYEEAAEEFGLCVFHALACDGKLDNSEAE